MGGVNTIQEFESLTSTQIANIIGGVGEAFKEYCPAIIENNITGGLILSLQTDADILEQIKKLGMDSVLSSIDASHL